MADITIIPLLNAQEQSMASLASAQATRPEMAQSVIQQLALSLLKEQAEQVQKPEVSAKSNLVDSEEKNSSGGQSGGQRQRRKQAATESMEPSKSTDPLVGNLLNLKI